MIANSAIYIIWSNVAFNVILTLPNLIIYLNLKLKIHHKRRINRKAMARKQLIERKKVIVNNKLKEEQIELKAKLNILRRNFK